MHYPIVSEWKLRFLNQTKLLSNQSCLQRKGSKNNSHLVYTNAQTLNVIFVCVSVSADSDDIPGIGQYDDFHTIDWLRDIARDRMRHRYILKKRHDSIWDLIKGAHDAWSGWLCVLLVGLFTGVAAGIIDIGASWMTDLKFGICPQAFWLNKEQCCWSYNVTTFDDDSCTQVNVVFCLIWCFCGRTEEFVNFNF